MNVIKDVIFEGKILDMVRKATEFVKGQIREIHFSRNPKIFEFLHEYEYVKEFGEGVDRMYREMEAAGLPEPEYRTVEFMLYATLKNHKWVGNQNTLKVTPQVELSYDEKLLAFCEIPHSQTEMIEFLGLSDRKHFRKAYLKPLLDSGQPVMTIPDKPNSRNQKYIRVNNYFELRRLCRVKFCVLADIFSSIFISFWTISGQFG